jgi:hypothetical protein
MGLFNKEEKKFESNIEEKEKTNFFGRARSAFINAVDQNDDGSFDIKDVSVLADNMGVAAKKAASAARQNAKQGGEQLGSWLDQTKRDMELKSLRPIFEEDLNSPEFAMTKMIRVAQMDKKHAESEVCKGSIGYMSEQKGVTVVNIYSDKADLYGLTYYPDRDSEIYYVDPFDRDRYVALDDYFHYLKVARVNELQRIAQDLGATHFRVTYKEDLRTEMENHQKGGLKAVHKNLKANEAAEVEHSISEKNSSTIEIAAEMECIGHEPVEPKLVYFQRDESIKNLIRLRMSDNPVKHQKFSLYCSHSSGIRVNDAAKIDAALAAMKFSMKASVTSKAQNEERRYFEYEIDF